MILTGEVAEFSQEVFLREDDNRPVLCHQEIVTLVGNLLEDTAELVESKETSFEVNILLTEH